MAKTPWNYKVLVKEQIVQRLESLRCTEIVEHLPGQALWKAPTGDYFNISYSECDAEYLEGIVNQIEIWVRHKTP